MSKSHYPPHQNLFILGQGLEMLVFQVFIYCLWVITIHCSNSRISHLGLCPHLDANPILTAVNCRITEKTVKHTLETIQMIRIFFFHVYASLKLKEKARKYSNLAQHIIYQVYIGLVILFSPEI